MQLSAASATREIRILALGPLVRRIATKVRVRIHSISIEDLIGWGEIGAIEAVDRYDPARGTLGAFARRRIRGAMLDGIGILAPTTEISEEPADPRTSTPIEITEALRLMTNRQRAAVERRMTGQLQREAAAELGVSRQAVSRLEARAYRRTERQFQRAA